MDTGILQLAKYKELEYIDNTYFCCIPLTSTCSFGKLSSSRGKKSMNSYIFGIIDLISCYLFIKKV